MVEYGRFNSSINSSEVSVAVDFDRSRSVLLIAFGGLAGKLGMPVFEFFNLTSALDKVNKIYLRDQRGLWYHAGLAGIGEDVQAIGAFLRPFAVDRCTERVIMLGNSGGGYAAMLFGHMLEAHEVHAFSPKTFIDPIKRIAALDIPRWRRYRNMLALLQSHRWRRQYFDLRKRLRDLPAGATQFHLYYASGHRVDRLHAERMKSLNGVHLHPYPIHGHYLIRQLKESGELIQIIERAIEPGRPVGNTLSR